MYNDDTKGTGCGVSNSSGISGSSRPMSNELAMLYELSIRLVRTESRLVQLMLHMGLNPYKESNEQNKQAGQ